MKTKGIFTVIVAGVTSLALPALADASGHGPEAMRDRTVPMPWMGDQFTAGERRGNVQPGVPVMGPNSGTMPMMMHGGMMHQMHQMHGNGMMPGHWMSALDTDEDGTISSEEFKTQMKARAEAHDTNGDDTLSITEFEALYGGLIRETMVDRFQQLDANGDGEVTDGEISSASKLIPPRFGRPHLSMVGG